jgi:hypothetical protein
VVAPARTAVDKLPAEKVLVPDIKAAEDLNLRPVAATTTALGPRSPLLAPCQPPDVTLIKLIVSSVGRRQPKASKPVAAIVVQIAGQFLPKAFQD